MDGAGFHEGQVSRWEAPVVDGINSGRRQIKLGTTSRQGPGKCGATGQLDTLVLKEEGGEGRERQRNGKRPAHVWDRLRVNAAEIADIRAAVGGGVSVEDFGVEAGLGNPNAVSFTDHGRGIHNHCEQVRGIFSSAEEG